MKYKVQVEGKFFEVEIEDLEARPVHVRVDDEWLEVWPESEPGASPEDERSLQASTERPAPAIVAARTASSKAGSQLLRAPIPGTIVNIMVKAGMEVTTGQELLVLEAMKMKNTIRSPRDGKISAIDVALGQSVKHKDVLVEFAE
jgi:biotin carboxyl carrier protein